MRCRKNVSLIRLLSLIVCAFLPLLSVAHTDAVTQKLVRIAIIDNLSNIEDRYTSSKYVDFYLHGIELAVNEAKQKNITMECKTFFYSNTTSLEIFDILPEVKKWHPDVIIGPRWSDQFLLLKDSLTDMMVISPFATAEEVYHMPKNFYSISPPNRYTAKAIIDFQESLFLDSALFVIVQADCKGCVDLAQNITTENNHKHRIKIQYFLEKEAESVNITKLLEGYDQHSPMVLAAFGNSTGVLMGRISTELKMHQVTFIGGDQWGGWTIWDAGKIKSNYAYQGFRISPWSTAIPERQLIAFNKDYVRAYQEAPDNISYVGYQVIRSIVEAMIRYPVKGQSTRETILESYQKAIAKNNDWFRPKTWGIYRLNQQGEVFYTSFPIGMEE